MTRSQAPNSAGLHLILGLASHWQAMASTFVILDLEVTDAEPATAEVLEVAALLANGSCQIVEELSVLIKTSRPVPELILRETGLSQEEIDGQGLDLADAWEKLLGFVGSHPVFIHHAPFDQRFLEELGKKTGVKFQNRIFDTIDITRETWPDVGPQNTSVLSHHVGYMRSGNRAGDHAKIVLAVMAAAREHAWQACLGTSDETARH